eukprot:Trichotokara_eunicae@DN6352_c1_g4_i1.p1
MVICTLDSHHTFRQVHFMTPFAKSIKGTFLLLEQLHKKCTSFIQLLASFPLQAAPVHPSKVRLRSPSFPSVTDGNIPTLQRPVKVFPLQIRPHLLKEAQKPLELPCTLR